MKVQIVTSEFPPEPQVQSRMALDIASALASTGHQVHVICPYPSRPAGVRYFEDEISSVAASVAERGIVLTRVPSFTTTESRLWPRMRESWSFGRYAAAVISKSKAADMIYDVVWPMLAQAWIGFIATRRGIPQVSHITDIYPESAYPKVPWWVQAGARRPLLALDRANALRARKLVVISETMRRVYEETRGVPRERLEVVHTWQDESMFRELPERASAVRRYNLPSDVFTFLYLGNIGPVAAVDSLVRAFSRANLHDAQLLIVGEGTQKQACMQLASQNGAQVRFLTDLDVANVPLLHCLADVCLLPMKRGAARSSFPSKLCGYMLSGKPVLASVDEQSDLAALMRKAECGWVLGPEDIEAMAGKMREVRSLDSRELAAVGARGRSYAMEHLSKRSGLARLTNIILDAAREQPKELPAVYRTPSSRSSARFEQKTVSARGWDWVAAQRMAPDSPDMDRAVKTSIAEIGFQVRSATSSDVEKLVALHYRVFDKNSHYLLLLGRPLLLKAYHWYSESPNAFTIMAENRHDAIGCATVNLGSYYAFFRKNWVQVAKAFLGNPTRILHPLVIHRLYALLSHRSTRRQNTQSDRSAYLGYLAVDAQSRGQGVGLALIQAAIESCRVRGWEQLVTCLHRTNLSAFSFYRKLGFERFPDLDTNDLVGMRISTACTDVPNELPRKTAVH